MIDITTQLRQRTVLDYVRGTSEPFVKFRLKMDPLCEQSANEIERLREQLAGAKRASREAWSTANDANSEREQLRAASLRLLDALDRLDHGSREPGFRGWENGHGEPCGDEVEDARQALAAVARKASEAIR